MSKDIIFIAGLSGAGKTTTLSFCEDLGFHTVSNLPVSLYEDFLKHKSSVDQEFQKTAILLDLVNNETIDKDIEFIRSQESATLIFLDCNAETLLKRYSETRRPHPKFKKKLDLTLEDTIRREKEELYALKIASDLVIDTTNMNLNQLKVKLKKSIEEDIGVLKASNLKVNFLSFGFKYGAPITCDLIFDLRFLPNPHYIDNLREKNGTNQAVKNFVLELEETKKFLIKVSDLLNFLIASFQKEGRAYLNIGIGCTGGKHRSVAIAEKLVNMFDMENCTFSVEHREL